MSKRRVFYATIPFPCYLALATRLPMVARSQMLIGCIVLIDSGGAVGSTGKAKEPALKDSKERLPQLLEAALRVHGMSGATSCRAGPGPSASCESCADSVRTSSSFLDRRLPAGGDEGVPLQHHVALVLQDHRAHVKVVPTRCAQLQLPRRLSWSVQVCMYVVVVARCSLEQLRMIQPAGPRAHAHETLRRPVLQRNDRAS